MNITAQDICHKEFTNLKFRKSPYRYITFKIDKETIVIDKIGGKDEDWEQFLAGLPNNEFRYCVYDFQFKNADNMAVEKLVFINWNADQTPLKARYLYATAKESFKQYLEMNSKDYILTSKDDMNYAEMIKELSK